jgi:hypothetical protein
MNRNAPVGGISSIAVLGVQPSSRRVWRSMNDVTTSLCAGNLTLVSGAVITCHPDGRTTLIPVPPS